MTKKQKTNPKQRGVLLYCYSNEQTDYELLARFCVSRLREFLPEVRIALVSDIASLADCVDTFISSDNTHVNHRSTENGTINYKNHRLDCFDVSPFDHTLLMDIDYILNTDDLGYLFHPDFDFPELLMGKSAININGTKISNRMTSTAHFYWTTLVAFSKTEKTHDFFNRVQQIYSSRVAYWSYHCIANPLWRNDFAFTLAANQLRLGPEPVVQNILCFEKTNYLDTHSPVVVDDRLVLSDVHFLDKQQLINSLNE
jgi:hypothetical protein